MEIETTLALFKTAGLALTPTCQNRLKERIVDIVNGAVTRSQGAADSPNRTRVIEARGKSHLRLVAKNMIEEGKRRNLKTLDEKVFDAASKTVGALVLD